MTDYLAKEAAGEGIEVDPDALSMIARASGGSLRDALSIMDQLVSFSGGRVTAQSASGLLRIVQTDMLESLALSILAGDAAGSLDIVSGAMELGYSVEEVCDSFVEYLRNLMLSASGGEAGLAELTGEERTALAAVASRTSDLVVLDVLRTISSAAFEARSSSLPRVVLESAVLAACRLQSAVNLKDMPPGTAAPVAPRRAAAAPPAAAAAVPQAPEQAEPDAAPAEPAPVTAAAREREPSAEPPAEPQAGPAEPPAEGAACGEAQEKERTRSILDLFDAIPYDTDRRKR
jgi:DNA polymerase-3 subunit gamma/tau